MIPNPLANPMAMSPVDPRAEQLKQLMVIMGGLGPNLPQPGVQPATQSPLLGGIMPGLGMQKGPGLYG